MRLLFDALTRNARVEGNRLSLSDAQDSVTRHDLLVRVSSLARQLADQPRIVGLYAPNGVEWAIAQIACALAGKIVVPLPTFFSAAQLGHIVRDASVQLLLATQDTWPSALGSGVRAINVDTRNAVPESCDYVDGFGQVIYTSGSTGQPKGVRHETGQMAWSATFLAAATEACETDAYLSVLPLPLLLETICAVFVPQLAGARTHFDTELANRVGRGDARGLGLSFAQHRPTTSVLVPQLLKGWLAELATGERRAPETLRFVAVGGAPVSDTTASAAWALGIPVHEGYGLSECCSVVAVNRVGQRKAGTAGRPLPGLSVTIDAGEIVVDGASVTDGYLNAPAHQGPWRTGDLGEIDRDGFLTVHGRKDTLIITAFGRNISPEWIETILLGDWRIAACAITGHGEPHLSAVIIPTSAGTAWFTTASEAEITSMIATCCAATPEYAVPRRTIVLSQGDAAENGLLTANGRFVRSRLPSFMKAKSTSAFADTL
jgi:long-subunit acyl-CoA synthetase (AMP-forming)